MFRPTTSFMACNQLRPQRLLVDIAYKHPQLLVDDDDADTDEININEPETTNKTFTDQQRNECKLIGNVNPTLIKTWQQLNAFHSDDNILPRANYPMNFVDGNRVADETATNTNSFIIRRANTTSEHFYDSIDNESLMTQDDEEHLIVSICDEMEAGGEALAEYISMVE